MIYEQLKHFLKGVGLTGFRFTYLHLLPSAIVSFLVCLFLWYLSGGFPLVIFFILIIFYLSFSMLSMMGSSRRAIIGIFLVVMIVLYVLYKRG